MPAKGDARRGGWRDKRGKIASRKQWQLSFEILQRKPNRTKVTNLHKTCHQHNKRLKRASGKCISHIKQPSKLIKQPMQTGEASHHAYLEANETGRICSGHKASVIKHQPHECDYWFSRQLYRSRLEMAAGSVTGASDVFRREVWG